MAEKEKDRAQIEAEKATQEFERRYNPSVASIDAYKRAMSNQLRQSFEQQRQTGQSYSDLYQQARRQAARQGAMSNVSGFGGGRQRGMEAQMSAAEIQALSGIAAQREGAMRDIIAQRQAIESNALLEAQQADAFQRAQAQQELARVEKVFEIIGSKKDFNKLSSRQKAQLRALGITEANFSQVTRRGLPTIETGTEVAAETRQRQDEQRRPGATTQDTSFLDIYKP